MGPTPPPAGPGDASIAVVMPADAVPADAVPPDAVSIATADATPAERGSGHEVPKGEPAPTSPSQAEIAAKLNEEGKAEMYANHYDNAAKKFEEAAARVPEPKYLFNLGTALFQRGRFGEAHVAMQAVIAASPPEPLAGKARKMLERIKQEAKAQGITLSPDAATPKPRGVSKSRETPSTAPQQDIFGDPHHHR